MALVKQQDSIGRDIWVDSSTNRAYSEGGKRDTFYNIDDWNARQSKKYNESSSSKSSKSSNSDMIQRAIELNRNAVKPAIQSYEASIPEIASKYSTQRDTLSAKYDNLLASIKGNQVTAENRQTVTTNNELGKRGILGSSGLAQQEMVNALNPITSEYTGLLNDTGLSKIGDMQSLFSNETAETRAVRNAIAQLQAGAGQTGVAQGLTQQQQALTRDDQLNQQRITNALNELVTKYQVGKPYYSPNASSGGALDLQGLLDAFNQSGGQ